MLRSVVICIVLASACVEACGDDGRGGLLDPRSLLLDGVPREHIKRVRMRPFTISGESCASMKRDLSAKGPVDNDGIRRYAMVTWFVSWRWARDAGGKVDVPRSDLELDIVIDYPVIDGEQPVRTRVREEWNRYVRAMASHERTHLRNAIDLFEALPGHVSDVVRADPAVSGRSLGARLGSFIDTWRERDRAYDAESRDGRLEGADLPAGC